eukprot:jgi/Tetstr1/447339/TSEL_034776.t1
MSLRNPKTPESSGKNRYGEIILSSESNPLLDENKKFAFAVDAQGKTSACAYRGSAGSGSGKTVAKRFKRLNNEYATVEVPIWKAPSGDHFVPEIVLCIEVTQQSLWIISDGTDGTVGKKTKSKQAVVRVVAYAGHHGKTGVSYRPHNYVWFPAPADNIVVDTLARPESDGAPPAPPAPVRKPEVDVSKLQALADTLSDDQYAMLLESLGGHVFEKDDPADKIDKVDKVDADADADADDAEVDKDIDSRQYMGICVSRVRDCFYLYDDDPLQPYEYGETTRKFPDLPLDQQVDAFISSIHAVPLREARDGTLKGINGYASAHVFELPTGTFPDPYVSAAQAMVPTASFRGFQTAKTLIHDVVGKQMKKAKINISYELKEIPGQHPTSKTVYKEKVQAIRVDGADGPKSANRLWAEACLGHSGTGGFERLQQGRGKDTVTIGNESYREYDDAEEKTRVEITEKYEKELADWLVLDPVQDNAFTDTPAVSPPNTLVCDDGDAFLAVMEMVKFREAVKELIQRTETQARSKRTVESVKKQRGADKKRRDKKAEAKSSPPGARVTNDKQTQKQIHGKPALALQIQGVAESPRKEDGAGPSKKPRLIMSDSD